jgi:hypothetical protein
VVALEAFQAIDTGTYVATLDLNCLRRVADRSAHRPMIFAGACMREVLHRIGVEVDLHIYIKRLSPMEIWCDEDLACGIDKAPMPGIEQELVDYHARWKPHERADIIFERIEGAESSR